MAVTKNLQAASSDDGSVEGQQYPSQGQVPQQEQHPSQPLHQHSTSNASTATVDIEAWTVAALESLSIAPTTIGRSSGNHSLSIPLDDAMQQPQRKLKASVGFDNAVGNGIIPPRRPPSRRDSIKRREELRKGNEGSRQRRRWENDHLLHVPNVQPPLPTDFQVHPTYPVLPTVPYQLATYWDRGLRNAVEERKAAIHKVSVLNPAVPKLGHVPRDLRATAKRTPAVKSWLRVLEEPVRQFVVERGLAITALQKQEEEAVEQNNETDPEDEEIVFVGRAGRATRDGKPPVEQDTEPKAEWKKASVVKKMEEKQQAEMKGMVLDTADDESGGAFKRWLTHSISDYYGLDSKSVVVGNPARKVIFVGVHQQKPKQLNKKPSHSCLPILPPPLWEMF